MALLHQLVSMCILLCRATTSFIVPTYSSCTIINLSTDPVDYIAVSMDLIFSAGDTRSCLDIPIKDDNILEGTENLFARLNTSDLDLNLESDEIEILILEDPNESMYRVVEKCIS